MRRLIPVSLLLLSLILTAAESSTFVKGNLVAWCVVPFDALHRGPVERAKMLKSLGITRFAYDWRAKDIPTWDAELDALNEQGIKLQAFWATCGLHPEKEEAINKVLDFLKRRHVKTQLWLMVGSPASFDVVTQEERVTQVAAAVAYVAGEAGKSGCQVGLYNHGGWYGEPENQLAVIRKLRMDNVGIVYNFHHGYNQIDRFPRLLAQMKPYLYAINLNGMKKGSHAVRTIGEGDSELEMLKEIQKSGYRGPIGIIHEQPELDAEIGLRRNIDGLRKLLGELHDEAALKTY